MPRAIDSLDAYYPKDRKAWRAWLQENHLQSTGIWLIYYKVGKSKPRLPYNDIVEECLCFGWIDGLARKLDDERSMILITPRKPKSVWSNANKERVNILLSNGLMTPAGLAKIETAKKNGSWDALTASDEAAKNNYLPQDVAKAFKGKKAALANFKAFAPSVRKQFLSWIDSAKTTETRNKRLVQTVLMSEANKKPGAQGFKL
ncbi:MAG: YdeI/OmpD-associated family protein [Chitinophagaceae bacterium]|jgi:uncharacterized protein YdeI (YjbR/CyaY-like superfamily)|nr:YdeI/OmpD-associated family protein [Chitinophagaceae bacterium]